MLNPEDCTVWNQKGFHLRFLLSGKPICIHYNKKWKRRVKSLSESGLINFLWVLYYLREFSASSDFCFLSCAFSLSAPLVFLSLSFLLSCLFLILSSAIYPLFSSSWSFLVSAGNVSLEKLEKFTLANAKEKVQGIRSFPNAITIFICRSQQFIHALTNIIDIYVFANFPVQFSYNGFN